MSRSGAELTAAAGRGGNRGPVKFARGEDLTWQSYCNMHPAWIERQGTKRRDGGTTVLPGSPGKSGLEDGKCSQI
jgi:hypothetical protein